MFWKGFLTIHLISSQPLIPSKHKSFYSALLKDIPVK